MSSRIYVPAGFRVVAKRFDGPRILISLAQSEARARVVAEKARREAQVANRTLPRRERMASIRIEHWVGTLLEGNWTELGRRHGGVLDVCAPRGTRREKPATGNGSPRSGDVVPCVLLAEKTRKGGWRARLASNNLVGPITNTAEVPRSARVGQQVALRIAALAADGTRIQFDWPVANAGQRPVRES